MQGTLQEDTLQEDTWQERRGAGSEGGSGGPSSLRGTGGRPSRLRSVSRSVSSLNLE